MEYLKKDIEIDYKLFAIMSSIILVVVLMLPYVSIGYSLYRVYFMQRVILSLAFIIGGDDRI